MLRLKRTFTIMLLVTTVPAAYSQSAPAKVKVGDVEYSVTPISRGRMLQVSDANGGLVGMAGVNGGNVSVLAGPPATINSVVDAYLHPTHTPAATAGTTAPPPSPPAASATVDDPNAAQRAALMAKLDAISTSAGNLRGANPLAPAQLTVEFPAAGGAIVHGTKFGDVTFNADATEIHSSRPTVSGTPETYVARWLGGDSDNAAKEVGHAAKDLAKAAIYVNSSRAIHMTNGNTYEVKTQRKVRGKISEFPLEEAGGLVSSKSGRDAGGSRGDEILDAYFAAETFAITQAKAKKDAKEPVNFDAESTPAGVRAHQFLMKYEHAN